jgi:hypothetical protein
LRDGRVTAFEIGRVAKHPHANRIARVVGLGLRRFGRSTPRQLPTSPKSECASIPPAGHPTAIGRHFGLGNEIGGFGARGYRAEARAWCGLCRWPMSRPSSRRRAFPGEKLPRLDPEWLLVRALKMRQTKNPEHRSDSIFLQDRCSGAQ